MYMPGISWKRYPQLPVCTRNRYIVSIERVYTPSTFYMKSAYINWHEIYYIGRLNRRYGVLYTHLNTKYIRLKNTRGKHFEG